MQPLASTDRPAALHDESSRLPREPSRFIGRQAELGALDALFHTGRALVSVLGPPGVGKTRLALRFARLQHGRYAAEGGGVFFCDLASTRDVDAMCVALGRTLGLAAGGVLAGPDRTRVVGRALAALGSALVVLDNIEQLLPHAEEVLAAWRAAAPRARWLLTTRQLVRLPEAAVYELGPLRVPRPGEPPAGADAVELFVDRVRVVRGGYAPGADALRAIAEVVRQLNGLPLAIELAASRMQAISPAQLLPRLSHRLELLPRDARARGPRQLTMYQAVDWSWGLLHPWEQSALSQCAVFRGSFSLAAAEHIVELPAESGVPPVRAVVQSLCDKSLLHVEPARSPDAPPRYAMYEGIRAFAAGKLAPAREAADALAARHAAYFLRATGPLAGREGIGGTTAGLPPDIDRDVENLEAVLEHGASAHAPDVVLRAAVALDALAAGNGLSRAQLVRLDLALHAASSPDEALSDLRARALGVRAASLRSLGRLTEAESDARAALAHALERGDQALETVLRHGLGEILFAGGDATEALAQWQRGLELARAASNRRPEVALLQRLGSAYQTLGELDEARRWYEQALTLALERGDGVGETRGALGMGSYHLERGLFVGSVAYYERALERSRALGQARLGRLARGYLGVLYLDQGLCDAAAVYLAEVTAEAQAAGDVRVEGVFRAVHAAALASLDRLEAAREAAAPVDTLLDDNAFFLATAGLYRCHVDLGEARRRTARGDLAGAAALRDGVRARIAAARSPGGFGAGPGGVPLATRSDDARIAIRTLERALARTEE